ncbi:DUF3011 domain-containing protein [Stenotrophomonas maltophilia]|nr:DUF3011 domain-containing protein [Stenotrophomonas maltophilia]
MPYPIGRMLAVPVVVGALMLPFCSHAAIPRVNAECPGGVQIHADEGGPVYVDGREAVLKRFSDTYYEARDDRSGLKVSLSTGADGSAQVSYTGRGGANGVCQVTTAAGATALGHRHHDDARRDDGDDDNLPNQVTCESDDQRQTSCDMNTRGTVIVDRQLSHARCVEGQTWGLSRHSVWVSGGCRAVFRNTSAPTRSSAAAGGGNALAACNARKGEDGTLVTQVPVGERYMEVIVDYADGRHLCMVGNDGTVSSLTRMRQR